ncbi:MAG TPA: methyl-accepting chemotaxis protein [Polyangiaceae bacterium]|jgi:methyl-accepting chemotaxis protein|nr:methyl-accepting chemotaxis protein [Polyangiaceae bacterium]
MTDGSDSNVRALPPARAARILAALDAVASSSARLGKNQKATTELGARQQAELDAALDAQQKLGARGRDLRNSMQLVRESLERAKLTALNAGLEGARLGEPVGKALVMMGDEVRNLLARGVDALEEHSTLLSEMDRERERATAELAELAESATKLASELNRGAEQALLTHALLGELRKDLGEVFGTDAEAARLMASSEAQVRTLTDLLLELSEHAPIGLDTLRELLEPLLALVEARKPAEREL